MVECTSERGWQAKPTKYNKEEKKEKTSKKY